MNGTILMFIGWIVALGIVAWIGYTAGRDTAERDAAYTISNLRAALRRTGHDDSGTVRVIRNERSNVDPNH